MDKAMLREKYVVLISIIIREDNKEHSTLLEELEKYNRTNSKVEKISKVKNND